MRSHRTGLMLVLVVLGLLAPAAAPAWSHAVLVEAQPADGARVEQSPDRLLLRFSEPVAPIAVRLLGADGRLVEDPSVEADGSTLTVRPAAPLAAGAYILSYRVTSLDGHPVGASLRFGIGAAAPQTLADSEPAGPWLAGVAVRLALYVTLLGSAGAALFLVLLDPPPPLRQRIVRLAAVLAAAAIPIAVLRLGIAGLELAGLSLPSLLAGTPWHLAATSSLGPATALAAVAAALLLLGRVRAAALAGSLLAAASFAATGHASAASPRLLTGPALAVHVAAASFWLGSLLPLAWAVGGSPGLAGGLVAQFSMLATVAVSLLAIAGVGLAVIQLGASVTALWSTAYGLRLLVKLGLVVLLLGIAVLNRRVLAPRLGHDRGAATWLRRTIGIDLALGLGVLAVTATFPLDPPPRAIAAVAADEASATTVTASEGRTATVALLPGRTGTNRFEAQVDGVDGLPVAAREATLRIGPADGMMEPLRLAATSPRPGHYTVADIPLPLAGDWTVRLDLLVDDFTLLRFETRVTIR